MEAQNNLLQFREEEKLSILKDYPRSSVSHVLLYLQLKGVKTRTMNKLKKWIFIFEIHIRLQC